MAFGSNQQLDQLRQRALQFEQARNMLTSQKGTFDQSANAQINTLNSAADSLYNAQTSGKITEQEYLGAIEDLHGRAERYAWTQHEIPAESIPGNFSARDGVQRIKTETGYEIVGYDPNFLERNMVPVGDSGHVAVPLGPGKGYQVVDTAKYGQRDPMAEDQMVTSAQDGIRKLYETMKKERLEKGQTDLNPADDTALMTEAARRYVADRMQAKNAAKMVNDTGISRESQRSVHGEAFDPHLNDAVENAVGDAPTPSMTPTPGDDRLVQSARLRATATPPSGEAPIYEESTKMPGAYKEAGFAEENLQVVPEMQEGAGTARPGTTGVTASDLGIDVVPDNAFGGEELPTVRPQNKIQEQLIEAAMMEKVPMAYSKQELETTFKGAAEGAVVDLADGRRFLKKDGKFIETPFSKAHTEKVAAQRINSLSEYLVGKAGAGSAKGLAESLKKMTPGMRSKALSKLGVDMLSPRLGFNLALDQEGIIREAMAGAESSREGAAKRMAAMAKKEAIDEKLKAMKPAQPAPGAVKQVAQAASAPPQVQEQIASAPSPDEEVAVMVSAWQENPALLKAYYDAKPAENKESRDKLTPGDIFERDGEFYYKVDDGKYLPILGNPPKPGDAAGPEPPASYQNRQRPAAERAGIRTTPARRAPSPDDDMFMNMLR